MDSGDDKIIRKAKAISYHNRDCCQLRFMLFDFSRNQYQDYGKAGILIMKKEKTGTAIEAFRFLL